MAFDTPGSVIQRAFTSGEITTSAQSRADLKQYHTGLNTCLNFMVSPRGGALRRSGFQFLGAVKTTTKYTRLLKFVFEGADQTYVIEAGEFYFRFWFHGARVVVSGVAAWSAVTNYVVGDLVVQGGVNYYAIAPSLNQVPPNASFWYPLTGDIYEIPTPYAEADLRTLRGAQSADVITIVHKNYAVRDLQRFSGTRWVLSTKTFGPSIAAPTGGAGVRGAAGTRTFRYQVTAAKVDTYEESYASSTITIASAATPTVDLPNTLSWNVVTGAAEYYVYCDPYGNGVFGYIGIASTNAFADVGFQPDYTNTPPVVKTVFSGSGNFPSTASYYQQRLVLGRTINKPETIWASKVGSYNNFSISTPLQDDDAIEFVIASDILQPVGHLVNLKRLLILTEVSEWLLAGDGENKGVLKPDAINPDSTGTIGSNPDVKPCVIDNSVVFLQARGSVLFELAFKQDVGGFQGGDLTLFATHLFEAHTVREMDYAKQPHSILWASREDGVLLGMTRLPDQEVLAWHRHTTSASGKFESVCCVPDTSIGEDSLYAVVKRRINSVDTRYVERLSSRIVTSRTQWRFMDSWIQYQGAPVTTITGLGHLEGQVVAVIAEGEVLFDGDPADALAGTYTVTAGQLTLPAAYGQVVIGLRFVSDLETLDLDVEGSLIRDKRKNLENLTVIVEQSTHGLLSGPDVDHLFPERAEPWEVAGDLKDGQIDMSLTSTYSPTGRLFLRHDQPTPMHVLAVIPNLELGG